jgi:hypothetical protein
MSPSVIWHVVASAYAERAADDVELDEAVEELEVLYEHLPPTKSPPVQCRHRSPPCRRFCEHLGDQGPKRRQAEYERGKLSEGRARRGVCLF